MSRTVFSPHSGKPVLVRDQDLGRALRDEAGRVFYVVQRPDRPGEVYGAKTRKGSSAEVERYDQLAENPHAEEAASASATDSPAASGPVHDATGGSGARSAKRRRVWAVAAVALIAAAAYALFGPLPNDTWRRDLPWNRPAEALESQPQPEPASPAPSAGLIAPVNFEPGEADPWRGWERDGDLRVLTVDMRPTAARIQPGGFVHYRQRVLTPGGRVIEALSTPLHRYAMAGVTPMLDPVERGLSGLRVGERRLVAVPRGLWPEDWRRAAGRSSAEALVLELAVVDLNPGVDVQTLVGGRGPEVRPGDRVEAHWIAFVGEQAKPMDSTRQQGAPRSLVVGAGQVIAGLEHGLIGMRVGETRRIGVPPALGFGERGLPPMIPPGASVTYQVRLESLEPAALLEPLAPAAADPAA